MILFIAQGYDTRELFAFEVFQGSAAARGDVADLVGQAGLVDSRDGVTAADDRNSIGISNSFGDCFRTSYFTCVARRMLCNISSLLLIIYFTLPFFHISLKLSLANFGISRPFPQSFNPL